MKYTSKITKDKLKTLKVSEGYSFLNVHFKSGNKKSWALIVLSFLLPIIAMMPGFIYSEIFPFGTNSTLAVDLRNEYVGFYESFRHALTNNGGFFYNMTKSLGGEMVGTFSYYMMSPWNLLFFLFPTDKLPIVVEITQLIKIGLAGAAFSILLIKKEHGRDYRVVLFSTLYALLSFSTANMLNHMWLDPIVIFPIAILGLHKVLEENKPSLYIISLALMIWTNFYIAYMGCIMLVIYAIYLLIRMPRPYNISKREHLIKQTGALLRFGLYSILAAGICAVLIGPTIYALIMSKGSYASDVVATWNLHYPVVDFFSKMLPGAFSYDEVPSGLPNVFTGTISIIFAFFYFLNVRINKRERFTSLLIVVFLILSMNISKLNIFWHGMQYPVWYEYRFSWVFSFFILIIAYRAIMRTDKISIYKMLLFVAVYIGMLTYFYFNLEHYSDYLELIHIIIAAVIVILLTIFLLAGRTNRKISIILVVIISFAEIAFNAGVHTSVYNYEPLPEFSFYDKEMNTVLADIRPKENEFWRIEKTFMHDNNDGMRFNFPTITHFNSALERKTVDLMSDLGFAVTKNSINGTNPTKLTDAIFGIKYYLHGNNITDDFISSVEVEVPGIKILKDKSTRPDLLDFKKQNGTEYIEVYSNDMTMPLGILAEKEISTLHSERLNPIDFQEYIANAIDGRDEEINYFERKAINPPTLLNIRETESENLTKYLRDDAEEDAKLSYSFICEKGSSYYLSVSNTLNKNNSTLELDGKKLANKRVGSNSTSQVYNVSAKTSDTDTHTFDVTMNKKKNSFEINNISLFKLNEDALKNAVTFQNSNGLKLATRTDTVITGTFTANKNTPYLLITLPYDKGWNFQVDKKKVEAIEVIDSLMAIPVTEGTHTLVMQYTLPYFKEGIVISIASLGASLVLEFGLWIHKKRKENYIQ